jgi:hypothetical protein
MTCGFPGGHESPPALTGVTFDTLATLMRPGVPPSVRLGAARTVAELGLHQHDANTIMERLDEIEANLRQREGR